jgi:UDPglucose 6-dehydrogenase
VEKLYTQLGTLKGKRIGVLGMAFKADTDDVRQSHSLPIVKNLLSQGAILTVNDPWIKDPQQANLSDTNLHDVEWVSSPYDAARDKDAILILTAWQEYRDLDLIKLKAVMKNPLIVDGRNIFNVEDMQAKDFKYLGVGI